MSMYADRTQKQAYTLDWPKLTVIFQYYQKGEKMPKHLEQE